MYIFLKVNAKFLLSQDLIKYQNMIYKIILVHFLLIKVLNSGHEQSKNINANYLIDTNYVVETVMKFNFQYLSVCNLDTKHLVTIFDSQFYYKKSYTYI